MTTLAKKIMTSKLITVQEGTSLLAAQELMQEKRIRHLPITNFEGDLIGILSQRDLQYVGDSKSLSVELFMSAPIHFVSEETPIKQVIFSLLEKKISCLLVADADDNAKGIITTDDLLWYLVKLVSAEGPTQPPLWNYKTQQTIGELANELSQMGI